MASLARLPASAHAVVLLDCGHSNAEAPPGPVRSRSRRVQRRLPLSARPLPHPAEAQ